jgi:hypothetical protein
MSSVVGSAAVAIFAGLALLARRKPAKAAVPVSRRR